MRLRYIDKWVSRPDRDLSPTWSTGFEKLVQDRRLPNKRLKLAAPGGQGRIPFVIDNLVRRSLSAIWEAIKRANDPRFLWPGATPLQVTQEEKQALQKLLAEFRNGFEHFQPAGWSIEVSGMPSLFRTAVGLIRRLAIDQGSVRYYSTEDRNRVSSAIAQLDGLVAHGGAA